MEVTNVVEVTVFAYVDRRQGWGWRPWWEGPPWSLHLGCCGTLGRHLLSAVGFNCAITDSGKVGCDLGRSVSVQQYLDRAKPTSTFRTVCGRW